MFTGRAVTPMSHLPQDCRVLANRHGGKVARVATTIALTSGLLIHGAFASVASPSSALSADAEPPAGTATADSGASTVTFGMAPASGGHVDQRGFLRFSGTPGATVYDTIAVVNVSQVPLLLDVYTADATNGADGSLQGSLKADVPELAGAWIHLDQPTVELPPQTPGVGPGTKILPVTIAIPADAEPGDHVGYVFTSLTAQGQAGDATPSLNLEQRVGVRVYITVEGQVRAGLTVTGVRAHFVPGSGAGQGSLEVEYTLSNTGNVRYGVEPSVRAAGPFGLAPHTADGTPIEQLLPHASVKQTVKIPGVSPLFFESVVVSATAVAAPGSEEPGIGTVHASTWTWVWSWLYLLVLVFVAAVVSTVMARHRRKRPGVWGPPEGPWSGHATSAAPAPRPPAAPEHPTAPERVP